eukprot:TRINITY_DN58771_c0_g1_i1.p1 TRINITY_DN58771_c0_g1~~TRINITY_DN58771_c0_g1_i1.p1  ORF type:complete len:303 (-),score=64.84 TRINITY_DN58771_c0_g1_i1:100-1008(-)
MAAFDFAELDDAEQHVADSKRPGGAVSGATAALPSRNSDDCTSFVAAEHCCGRTEKVDTSVSFNQTQPFQLQKVAGQVPRMSRARAWFEIKRFFDAEPQKYYGSPDAQEWKIYYAKELILKTMCEKLQSDGFVVIDALLSPAYFQQLAQQLLNEAPEQQDALECHAGRRGDCKQDFLEAEDDGRGWIGSHLLRAGSRRQETRSGNMSSVTALVAQAGSGEMDGLARTLCESCRVTLALGQEGCSSLQPQTKDQFLRIMKTYLHVISANSISEVTVRREDKIPVQFCFGDVHAMENARLSLPG